MTEAGRHTGGPWSVDLLAELHAGALDDAEAGRLWQQVQTDPDAMAVLSALDATTADLAGLAEEDVAPMPADVAARIDAAIAAESASFPLQGSADGVVVDMASARRRRNRRLGWSGAILTAAAAAVAAVVLGVPATTPGTPHAEQGQPTVQPPPAVDSKDLADELDGTLDAFDYGPFEDRNGLADCLEELGYERGLLPAGVKQITLDGDPATLIVLPTGVIGQLRLLAVSADCELLQEQVVP